MLLSKANGGYIWIDNGFIESFNILSYALLILSVLWFVFEFVTIFTKKQSPILKLFAKALLLVIICACFLMINSLFWKVTH